MYVVALCLVSLFFAEFFALFSNWSWASLDGFSLVKVTNMMLKLCCHFLQWLVGFDFLGRHDLICFMIIICLIMTIGPISLAVHRHPLWHRGRPYMYHVSQFQVFFCFFCSPSPPPPADIIYGHPHNKVSYLKSLNPLLFENIAYVTAILLDDDLMIWWSSCYDTGCLF